jgi:hypothetical protein
VFTVPLRPVAATISRHGLPDVYHGDNKPPYRSLVHTDFGADIWMTLIDAGFATTTLVVVEYPSGVAFEARKHL